MRATILVFAAAAVVVLASDARAAFLDLDASDLGGNTVDVSSPGPGQLAIDPDFTTATPMTLAIVLEPADAASIAWNALVDNLTGEVWSQFQIEVVGAFLATGSATANAGAVSAIVAGGSRAATVLFDPAEAAGIDLGAPFGIGEDWGVYGIEGGFSLRLQPIAVPEPGTLGAIGLGIAALAARRSGIVRARDG
jgi:hypothetical protein